MQFISDPPISAKINQMKRRVRWQEPALKERGIDQTFLSIDDPRVDNEEFSFLVIGDSGSGEHYGHHPQREIAKMMQQQSANFILHTGDVVYNVGSSEYYPDNFIKPYREWLVGGEVPKNLSYDRLVFKLPFLPVLGNHDYYDFPLIYGILSQATWGLRHLLRTKVDLNVGWHGSFQGQAYAKAFLDYLLDIHSPEALKRHLDQHYTGQMNGRRCLLYQPSLFTRLPNRYYTFRYGGVDFFALDSNTFNSPLPLPETKSGEQLRQELTEHYQHLESEKQYILGKSQNLQEDQEKDEKLDDFRGKIEQIEEEQRDINKRLNKQKNVIDSQQLNWLKDQLIQSWQNDSVRGRVIYFHHPPYVTEASKWNQGQTLAMRWHLRRVLDEVAQSLGEKTQKRPIVDLVLSGHAHCFEHLYTENTGHADAYTNWVVCGGSGHSLRRQRTQGAILMEADEQGQMRQVAQSLQFIGRNGHGSDKKRPYSFVKIDVQKGNPVKFVLNPYVAERHHHQWNNYSLDPVVV